MHEFVNRWKHRGARNSVRARSSQRLEVGPKSLEDAMGSELHEIPEESTEDEDRLSPAAEPTPYEKLLQAVLDPKFSHEVTLEKRVGLYKFCGDIGRGNFSRVKKAVHLLTKGERIRFNALAETKAIELFMEHNFIFLATESFTKKKN